MWKQGSLERVGNLAEEELSCRDMGGEWGEVEGLDECLHLSKFFIRKSHQAFDLIELAK